MRDQERMITHPEKLLFPDDGIHQGEVAAHYEAVAPFVVGRSTCDLPLS
jgi:DNA primase